MLNFTKYLFLLIFPVFIFSSLKNMTLEEKIGQILMVHFHGKKANDEAKELIQKLHIGGIVYYNWANELISFQQVKNLSKGLQKLAYRIPLLIALDQEGGRISRLNKGFPSFLSNKEIGDKKDFDLAKRQALDIGKMLKRVGINMNLAPVVDINSNLKNPVIGDRSFGSNPKMVSFYGEKAIEGYHEVGIITTLKHFPGHGDVLIDSHIDLPILDKNMQKLEEIEFFPFSRLASKTDAIMTAHILVPALDSSCCATLSKKILSYLREQISFQGVIISDSLIMDGILKQCSIDEAAVKALNAGCDILLLGGKLLIGSHKGFELTVSDIKRVHRSLVTAVRKGLISEKRLDSAVQKVIELKKQYLDFSDF